MCEVWQWEKKFAFKLGVRHSIVMRGRRSIVKNSASVVDKFSISRKMSNPELIVGYLLSLSYLNGLMSRNLVHIKMTYHIERLL